MFSVQYGARQVSWQPPETSGWIIDLPAPTVTEQAPATPETTPSKAPGATTSERSTTR